MYTKIYFFDNSRIRDTVSRDVIPWRLAVMEMELIFEKFCYLRVYYKTNL
jgi:hypothetical protein